MTYLGGSWNRFLGRIFVFIVVRGIIFYRGGVRIWFSSFWGVYSGVWEEKFGYLVI